MHELVMLAKKTIEEYIKNGNIISPPEKLTEEMKEKAGVFVSLKKHGELRGCIGTIEPQTDSIAEEVIKNAICSATQDTRFRPVGVEELPELEYSVDVLAEPEPVKDVSLLNPKRFGVIVSKGRRRGLLLPNLEGVDTVEQQLNIAMMKAGINSADEDIRIEKFEVRRYK